MTQAADPGRSPDGGVSALVGPRGHQGGIALRGHLTLTAPAKAGARPCLLAPLPLPAGGLAGTLRGISAPWTPATATLWSGRGY